MDRPVLIVTPYSLESNPYIRLLVEALDGQGVRVELARGTSPILLWRSLRRHGVPRVVHLQWHHPYLTDKHGRITAAMLRTLLFFAQWALLRTLGARFVWTVHNLLGHEGIQARWELFASRRLARCVDALVAHCAAAAEEVAALYGVSVERVRVVPHGQETQDSVPDRHGAPRARSGREGNVVLLNFGRIRAYKGVDDLIRAFRRGGPPGLELEVVGYPDDLALAEALKQEAKGEPRIRLRLEEVGEEELSRLLGTCDAVVLPYRSSLTSGAAVLAAAHGRPVIAPRLGCLREWPEDAGILYDPEDETGLERALARAADAPLAAMGAAARRHVGGHTWEWVAERTEEVYRLVTRGSGAALAGL